MHQNRYWVGGARQASSVLYMLTIFIRARARSGQSKASEDKPDKPFFEHIRRSHPVLRPSIIESTPRGHKRRKLSSEVWSKWRDLKVIESVSMDLELLHSEDIDTQAPVIHHKPVQEMWVIMSLGVSLSHISSLSPQPYLYYTQTTPNFQHHIIVPPEDEPEIATHSKPFSRQNIFLKFNSHSFFRRQRGQDKRGIRQWPWDRFQEI